MPIGHYAVGAAFRKEDKDLRHAFDDASRQLMLDSTLERILGDWGMTPTERYLPAGCKPPPDLSNAVGSVN